MSGAIITTSTVSITGIASVATISAFFLSDTRSGNSFKFFLNSFGIVFYHGLFPFLKLSLVIVFIDFLLFRVNSGQAKSKVGRQSKAKGFGRKSKVGRQTNKSKGK